MEVLELKIEHYYGQTVTVKLTELNWGSIAKYFIIWCTDTFYGRLLIAVIIV